MRWDPRDPAATPKVNPAIHSKLPYDPVKSFEPIGFTGRTGLILLANKDQPIGTLKQLVAAAKATGATLTDVRRLPAVESPR